MQISIDFYIKSRDLIQPFKTSRSEVSKKDILIIIFDNKFPFELPLSPSMGEMPNDTILMAKEKKLSRMTKRALSYYKGMILDPFTLPIVEPIKQFHTITYDINNKNIQEGDYLQRFKGSVDNMQTIIDWSHANNDTWTVDFNEGLNHEQLKYFIDNAKLDNCVFIEQPIPSGDFSLPESPVDYWVDEGLKNLSPNKFLESPFKGFMLKPIAFNFDEFHEWIAMAVKNEVPFFVSGLTCDNLHHEFLKAWNNCSTYQNIYPRTAAFFTEELDISPDLYEKNDYLDAIKKIKSSFEHITNITIQI